MASINLTKEMTLNELADFLREKLENRTIEVSGARTWVKQDTFRACWVKAKPQGGTTRVDFAGEAPLRGRIAFLVVWALLLSPIAIAGFQGNYEALGVAGVLFIVGSFLVRTFPSRAIAKEVEEAIRSLPHEKSEEDSFLESL